MLFNPYTNITINPVSKIVSVNLFGIILCFRSIKKAHSNIGISIKNFIKSKFLKKLSCNPNLYNTAIYKTAVISIMI